MFSRENYDNRVISTFEVIGCYFVDVFYNHIYHAAKDRIKLAMSPLSLTDSYKSCVCDYVLGASKKPDYYKKMITGLHLYYQEQTSFSTITLGDFINNVIQQYAPKEYYSIMREHDKNAFFGKTILNVIGQFRDEILEFNILRKIIDEHKDQSNIRLLTNKIVHIQVVERELTFHKFAEQFSRGDRPLTKEQVDKNIVEKILNERNVLAEQVKKLLKEKCTLQLELTHAKTIAEQLGDELARTHAKYAASAISLPREPSIGAESRQVSAPAPTPTTVTARDRLRDKLRERLTVNSSVTSTPPPPIVSSTPRPSTITAPGRSTPAPATTAAPLIILPGVTTGGNQPAEPKDIFMNDIDNDTGDDTTSDSESSTQGGNDVD